MPGCGKGRQNEWQMISNARVGPHPFPQPASQRTRLSHSAAPVERVADAEEFRSSISLRNDTKRPGGVVGRSHAGPRPGVGEGPRRVRLQHEHVLGAVPLTGMQAGEIRLAEISVQPEQSLETQSAGPSAVASQLGRVWDGAVLKLLGQAGRRRREVGPALVNCAGKRSLDGRVHSGGVEHSHIEPSHRGYQAVDNRAGQAVVNWYLRQQGQRPAFPAYSI